MSDIMKSITFGQLMEWILAEHKETGQVFGIQKAYVADTSKTVEIFGRKLENPSDRQQVHIHSLHRILWLHMSQVPDFLN